MISSNGSTEVSVKPVIGGLAPVIRSLTAVCLASAQALVFGFRLFGTAAHGKVIEISGYNCLCFRRVRFLCCILKRRILYVSFVFGFATLDLDLVSPHCSSKHGGEFHIVFKQFPGVQPKELLPHKT